MLANNILPACGKVQKLKQMTAYICSRCDSTFPSRQALGGHMSVLVCPQISTAVTTATTPAEATHVVTGQISATATTTNQPPAPAVAPAVAPAAAPATAPAAAPAAAPAVAPAAAHFSIDQLLRRPKRGCHKHIVVPLDITPSPPCDERNTYRLYEV
jgi:hypothetical protein